MAGGSGTRHASAVEQGLQFGSRCLPQGRRVGRHEQLPVERRAQAHQPQAGLGQQLWQAAAVPLPDDASISEFARYLERMAGVVLGPVSRG